MLPTKSEMEAPESVISDALFSPVGEMARLAVVLAGLIQSECSNSFERISIL